MKKINAFVAILLLVSGHLFAQAPPQASPDDVKSVDAIIAALYDVISGDAGAPRDWDRMKSLFVSEAHLIPTYKQKEGGFGYRAQSPDGYIERSAPYFEKNGFYEYEIHRVTQEYGRIVHVFSTYGSKRSMEDPEPFMRGINSIQLFHDGTRWWILNITWAGESDDMPVPKEYLPEE